MLGLRSEASSRFEKQLHPDLCDAGPADRLAADGRALRRAARAGHDRRRRRAAAARPSSILRGAPGRRDSSASRSPQADQVAYLERLGFGVEARRRRPDGHGAARPPLRRDPRGRPDRGGRPRPRPRRAPAGDAARRGRPGRRAEPRAAPAPPGRGRDAGPRLRRDRRLELHRPRRARPAADRGRRSAGRRASCSPTRSPRTSR